MLRKVYFFLIFTYHYVDLLIVTLDDLYSNKTTFMYAKLIFRFFKAVNSKEGKLKIKRRSFLLNDADLIGLDYLWRVSTSSTNSFKMCKIDKASLPTIFITLESTKNTQSAKSARVKYTHLQRDCHENISV